MIFLYIFFLVNIMNIEKRRVKLVKALKLVLLITNVIVKLIYLWILDSVVCFT